MDMAMDSQRSFLRVIKSWNHHLLSIPHEFVKENRKSFRMGYITAQRSPDATPWILHLNQRKDSGGLQLTGGWPELQHGNNLEAGDIIMFTLVEKNVFSFQVYDFTGLEKQGRAITGEFPEPIRAQKQQEQQLPRFIGFVPPRTTRRMRSRVITKLPVMSHRTMQIVNPYHLYVPFNHAFKFPSHNTVVMFEDSQGTEWELNWFIRTRTLKGGVVKFLRANKIEVGDFVHVFPGHREGHYKARKLRECELV